MEYSGPKPSASVVCFSSFFCHVGVGWLNFHLTHSKLFTSIGDLKTDRPGSTICLRYFPSDVLRLEGPPQKRDAASASLSLARSRGRWRRAAAFAQPHVREPPHPGLHVPVEVQGPLGLLRGEALPLRHRPGAQADGLPNTARGCGNEGRSVEVGLGGVSRAAMRHATPK